MAILRYERHSGSPASGRLMMRVAILGAFTVAAITGVQVLAAETELWNVVATLDLHITPNTVFDGCRMDCLRELILRLAASPSERPGLDPNSREARRGLRVDVAALSVTESIDGS